MSGWTYEVVKRKVKTKTCTVRAYTEGDAIEFAKRLDWGDIPSTGYQIEYEAREIY
jgi:hypothetical protein